MAAGGMSDQPDGVRHEATPSPSLLSVRQKVESPGLSKRRFCAFDWPKRRSACLGLSSFWSNDHKQRAQNRRQQHLCNSSKSVPNRPLWGRRGRFGTLLEQLECGIFGRTAVDSPYGRWDRRCRDCSDGKGASAISADAFASETTPLSAG